MIRAKDDDLGPKADQFVTVKVPGYPKHQSSGIDDIKTIMSQILRSQSQAAYCQNSKRVVQSSDPDELYNHGGRLFFSANNGRNGQEPWISQGTTESTALFLDINNGQRSSSPSHSQAIKTHFFRSRQRSQGIRIVGLQRFTAWNRTCGRHPTWRRKFITIGFGGSGKNPLYGCG